MCLKTKWVLKSCFCVFPQRDCILSISQFVRENPRASTAAINAEVEKRVLLFAARVKTLEAAPILWTHRCSVFYIFTDDSTFLKRLSVTWRVCDYLVCVVKFVVCFLCVDLNLFTIKASINSRSAQTGFNNMDWLLGIQKFWSSWSSMRLKRNMSTGWLVSRLLFYFII